MTYDVARVRGLIPALGDGWIHLDAVAGMQPPENVVSAVSAVFRRPRSAPGGPFASSCMSGDLEAEARRAVADLVGADPRGVVLGPGPAPLLRRLADAVGDICSSGDEIVVSRLDDAVNVAPWLWAARRRGVTVRWAEIDIETCELPVWQFDDLLTGGTRVVALTAASGQVGTRVDVGAVAERTRAEGALLVVDACASAAYGPARIDELGADVVGFAPASRGLRARGSAPVRASRGLRACESRSGCDRVGLLLGAFPCAGRVRVCASRGVRASGAPYPRTGVCVCASRAVVTAAVGLASRAASKIATRSASWLVEQHRHTSRADHGPGDRRGMCAVVNATALTPVSRRSSRRVRTSLC